MILFLDSNIYIGAKYRVNKGRFSSLRLLLEHGDIKLLYTSVNLGEIKQHIKKDIAEGVAAYNKVLKDKSVLLTAGDVYHLNNIEESNGIKSIEDTVLKFFQLPGVECVPIDPINVETLMQDYFNQVPPFESKKPTEFKDAIIINALRNYQRIVQEPIGIISLDKGFLQAFEGDSGFIVYGKIDDFLVTRNKEIEDYAICECIENFIDDGDANDDILNFLQDWDINRGYYGDWECENKEITDVESEFLYFDIDGEQLVAHLQVQTWLKAEIKHRDEDDSFYDKEDQCYLYESWVTAIENHRITVDIDLLIQIKKNSSGAYNIEGMHIIDDEKYHWLNIDDYSMTHYREIDSAYMGETRDGLVQCSCCGKVIGRNYNGAFFDYDGNPVCDNCMRADSHYDICPRCGRRVPQEYMMSGFCDKCISLNDL